MRAGVGPMPELDRHYRSNADQRGRIAHIREKAEHSPVRCGGKGIKSDDERYEFENHDRNAPE